MTTTPQGLTSPHRHAKAVRHPRIERRVDAFVLWLDDLTASERVFQAVRALLLVIIAIAILGTLTACGPDQPAWPAITPAVSTTPTPVPAPTTTWEQVAA